MPQYSSRVKPSARKSVKPAFGLALAFTLGLGLAAGLVLSSGTLMAASPEKVNYQNSPIMSTGRTVPRVLLVLSKDRKMFLQAYNEFTDMDGDGRVDTGFNPAVIYYGYFDSKSCYQYTGDVTSTFLDDPVKYSSRYYFKRVGATIPDDSESTLISERNAALGSDSRVKPARAVYFKTGEDIGVCQKPNTGGGNFSGNFLNYVSMTRMDVIRKILYGGYRRVDKSVSDSGATYPKTILEGTYVPTDANVWGTDVLADNRWESETPLTNYYDISKYTPFPKPDSDTAHMFARTKNMGEVAGEGVTNKPFPQVIYILNVKASHFIPGFNITNKGRWFDWVVGTGQTNPGAVITHYDGWTSASGYRYRTLNVMVEVCGASYSAGEDCRGYADGTLKPVGLLQKNGENNQMLFGLLTGTFHGDYITTGGAYTSTNNYRRRGGVIRSHMGGFANTVNPTTGQIKAGGLIDQIDSLTIAGARTPVFAAGYTTSASWGNPTGEMLYEAVRYFAFLEQNKVHGALAPTAEYLPPVASGSQFYPTGEWKYAEYQYKTFNPSFLRTWSGIGQLESADCAKPIILLLADMESDFDGDTFPSSLGGFQQSVNSKIGQAYKNKFSSFSVSSYLAMITQNEGLASSVSGKNYFYSSGRDSDCSPKSLTSLWDVQGMCPSTPSLMGTYSAAAVAYYAHTHDYTPGDLDVPLDIYAVTMGAAFPEVAIPVYNSSGEVLRKISVLPASMSSRDLNNTTKGIVGFLNYSIIEWKVDENGTPYHVKFKVNFEDATQGFDTSYGRSDWEMDAIVEYTIDLVTTSATATSKRQTAAFSPAAGNWSGALKVNKGTKTYHLFRTDDSVEPFAIDLNEIEGLVVASWKTEAEASLYMSLGYLISGSTHDGTYMDQGHAASAPTSYCTSQGLCTNYPLDASMKKYSTPPSCNWPAGYGATQANGTGCGSTYGSRNGHMPASFKVFRTFEFNSDPAKAGSYLPNPLYYVAKYGGFIDFNGNGVPDPGEWEREDGLPKNYFEAKNIAELPGQLEAAFQDIARSISTGTATSASVDRILGGGVSVQSIYYPLYVNPMNSTQQTRWAGTVFGLFVDKWGNLREDSDQDGILNVLNGPNGSKGGDYIVTFNSTKDKDDKPPKCYVFGPFISRCYDEYGDYTKVLPLSGIGGHPQNLHRVDSLFDTGRWLAELDGTKLLSGARGETEKALRSTGKRRILYGKPVSTDPSHPALTVLDASQAGINVLEPFLLHGNWRDQIPSAATKNQAAGMLVKWIIGVDQTGLRSRVVGNPWTDNSTLITWRLGDVINSKPILVGSPASNYDLLYGDVSYLNYKRENGTRRQMTYFGANDGMLHAVNVGFYGSYASGQVSFTAEEPTQSANPNLPKRKEHDLGAELWAYIPTSLLPHLQWLPDPEYNHANYVDLKPVINDVKINGEWKTILIGGLRMAARPIEAPNPAAFGAEFFYSEIFVLDITDPEGDPELLWRYSDPKAGLTVGLPSVISHDGDWYVVLPSGPVTDVVVPAGYFQPAKVVFGARSPYEGYSNQRARLIVLKMETGKEITFENPVNDYLTVSEPNSFFNNPFLPMAQIQANPWTNHALYYGLTVSQDPFTCEDSGAVYRLKTVNDAGEPLQPAQWTLERLLATGRPVTGAVNMTYDNVGNLWVLFGTGRLWNSDDILPCRAMQTAACKANHQQFLYGIKEELNSAGFMTFKDRTGDASKIVDVTKVQVQVDGDITGLPNHSGVQGLQNGASSYSALKDAILGDGAVGYKRQLNIGSSFASSSGGSADHNYEMIITQPKVFSAIGLHLMAFTSYEPNDDGCGEVGDGFLYLVDTFTGLPDPASEPYFRAAPESDPSDPNSTGEPTAPDGDDLMVGAVKVGKGNPTEAFILVTSAGVSVSASAPDASMKTLSIDFSNEAESNLAAWREVLNAGFELTPDAIVEGL
ncbi:MAG: hypothetical protein LBR53_12245 [Deltaproteobacteria bacterium]|nr:hypothetical protein [Deltaproteobacteria bacterium]